jgi:hypothetical protein
VISSKTQSTIYCNSGNSVLFSSLAFLVAVIDGCDASHESSTCHGAEEYMSPFKLGPRKAKSEFVRVDILPALSTRRNDRKLEFDSSSDQVETGRCCQNSAACSPGKTEPAMLFSQPKVIDTSATAALAGADAAEIGPSADYYYLLTSEGGRVV